MQQVHARYDLNANRHVRRFGIFVFAGIVAIVLMVCCPSQVEATCGDYLAHDQQPQRDHKLVGDVNASDDSQPPSSGRVPCHGPFCQKGEPLTPLSTPVVSFDPQDRWGWIASMTLSAPQQISYLAHVSEPVTLPMIVYRLDRPPKV